jgi:hypothetical protein
VKILTGIVFSNVAIAVVPKVVRQDVIYVSANAGPSLLAGKGCHKNYFNVAYQNDNLDEVVGKYVTDAGFKNVYLLAPTTRPAKITWADSSATTKGPSPARSTPSWASRTMRPRLPPCAPPSPTRCSFSCPGAWASIFSNNTPRPD